MNRNCDRFNSGDAEQDFNEAVAAYKKETGETVYNLVSGESGTSGGRFLVWLMSKSPSDGTVEKVQTGKIEEKTEEPTILHQQYAEFRKNCGPNCGENEYHLLRCIPALCFVRWLVRKTADKGYVEIDGKRYYAAETAIPDPDVSKLLRENEEMTNALNHLVSYGKEVLSKIEDGTGCVRSIVSVKLTKKGLQVK